MKCLRNMVWSIGHAISVYGMKQLVFKKNLHCQEVRTDFYQFHVFVRYASLSSFTFTLYFFCIFLAVLIFCTSVLVANKRVVFIYRVSYRGRISCSGYCPKFVAATTPLATFLSTT